MNTTSSTPPSPAVERGLSFLDPQITGGPMRLSDLVEGYWALTPCMHDEIRSIYDAHMRGDKIDIRGVEARLGRPLANERQPYQVVKVHLSKDNLARLDRHVKLYLDGLAKAGQIRDRISSRRAQGQIYRAEGRSSWMW